MYNITDYSYMQARRLGVQIKLSTNKKKKIDVFNDGKKVASIGAMGMYDYPSYIKDLGKEFADRRRAAYKKRHEKYRHIVGSNSYYSDQILW